MKSIRGIIWAVGMACTPCLLYGQTAETGSFNNNAAPVQSGPPDSIVQITAEAQGLSVVSYDNLPRGGTYWVVMANGMMVPWPCPPIAFGPEPIYCISGNIFLVDATGGNVAVNPRLLGSRNANVSAASGLEVLASEVVNLIQQIQTPAALPAMASRMTRMSMMASSLASSYAYGNPVYLTNLTASVAGDGSLICSFGIGGGTNFVPYDVLMCTNVAIPFPSWNWLGIGYTSNNYAFHEQPADSAFYILAKPSKSMTVAWGDDFTNQCDVPLRLTNALQVAGGYGQSLALRSDGTVVAWGGTNDYAWVPPNLAGVSMIACGWNHNVALLTNGTVIAWGLDVPWLYPLTNVPPNLTNAIVISAQALHTLALQSNGTVVAWGHDSGYGDASVPAALTNVTAICAGGEHNLAVSNGFVVPWGYDEFGQCEVPKGLSNVWDVAAGWRHSVALKNDGTVVCWGDDSTGESSVPTGLSNVVAIAAGGDPFNFTDYTLALRKDGTVIVWGDSEVVEQMGGMSNVIGIGGGADYAFGIRTGPPTPVITLEPVDQYAVAGGNVTFNIKGVGLDGVTYQWQTNGVNIGGATNLSVTVTAVQSTQLVACAAVVTDNNGMGSIISSNAFVYVVNIPVVTAQTLPGTQIAYYQSNVTLSVSASATGENNGFPLSYQWKFNGTNISDTTASNIVSAATPGIYSVIISNAAGSTNVSWTITGFYPDNVWGWGDNEYGESVTPSGVTNISGIAAGDYHSVAVEDKGTVIQWGFIWGNIPTDLTNAMAVAAGYDNSMALRSDGTVVTWGTNTSPANYVPTGLKGVKAVACGWDDNVVLLTNGTVKAWGFDGSIFGWGDMTDVASLTNITAISAQALHALALTSAGTVVAWGDDGEGQSDVPVGLSNVVAVAAGEQHSLALLNNGRVVAWGYNYSGQCNVPVGLSNVMGIAAGADHSVALLNNGTLVCWGDNTEGQTNAPPINRVKLIAAGGRHTLGNIFSPSVTYPVDVAKDLLLVYNTNSIGSRIVENYYLQNRPLAMDANVLGLGCPTNEIITPGNFATQILGSYQNWLSNNPTKHPQYIVLFMDIPSRVESASSVYPSVQYQLSVNTAGIQPFVTSINMNGLNGTNDCIAYINKLVYIGTNYSLGKLVISASAGGYGNTNYYFDDTDIGYGGTPAAFVGAHALINDGVSSNSVYYTNMYPDCYSLACHIATGMNVAGYCSWGQHSSLGPSYATNGYVQWSGNSGWWIIETFESFNGQVIQNAVQSNFIQWFSSNAFGGVNYANTPVGAVTSVEEPGLGVVNAATYYGLWAAEKNFAISAWNARTVAVFQAVGDPFIAK